MFQLRRALVTGASSAIGLQIARQLAGAGTELVIDPVTVGVSTRSSPRSASAAR